MRDCGAGTLTDPPAERPCPGSAPPYLRRGWGTPLSGAAWMDTLGTVVPNGGVLTTSCTCGSRERPKRPTKPVSSPASAQTFSKTTGLPPQRAYPRPSHLAVNAASPIPHPASSAGLVHREPVVNLSEGEQ